MSIIIFILVLVALIVVHELGHFFAAKWAGMKVDEFGLGYPPRAMTWMKKGGTEYTLNWLPFGGFVKIRGEDDTESRSGDSFSAKPWYVQALVLIAGIAMNLAFAWVLLSLTLYLGMPRGLADDEIAKAPDAALAVSTVAKDSPAAAAGVAPGDLIRAASAGERQWQGADAEAFTAFIAASAEEPVSLIVSRNWEELTLTATPAQGVVPTDAERYALGVGVGAFGTVPVSLLEAPIAGAELTIAATGEIAVGLTHFFAGLLTFSADLSEVSGPVGIAGAVGSASDAGIAALLTLTAVISINLALINLLPVPALDGGRLLFVLIEAAIRRPLPKSFAGTANAVGFFLLILLMIIVTANDLWKIFS